MGSGVKALCITVWRAGIVVAVFFDKAMDILLKI